MNQKHIFAAIAVVVVLIAGFLLFNQADDSNELASNTNTSNTADSTENVNTANTNTVDNSNVNVPTNTTTPPATGEPTVPQDPDIAVFEIVYNGTSFSPSQLTIKNGDVVIFKNESNKSFWPASGPHPEHTNYPEFDPKKAIAAGQDWQFKFTKAGSWPFHDHLNASVFGKITVQ